MNPLKQGLKLDPQNNNDQFWYLSLSMNPLKQGLKRQLLQDSCITTERLYP